MKPSHDFSNAVLSPHPMKPPIESPKKEKKGKSFLSEVGVFFLLGLFVLYITHSFENIQSSGGPSWGSSAQHFVNNSSAFKNIARLMCTPDLTPSTTANSAKTLHCQASKDQKNFVQFDYASHTALDIELVNFDFERNDNKREGTLYIRPIEKFSDNTQEHYRQYKALLLELAIQAQKSIP